MGDAPETKAGETAACKQADEFWGWLEQGKEFESRSKDGFAIFTDDPFAGIQRKLNAYLKQTARTDFWNVKSEKYPAGREIIALGSSEAAEIMRAVAVRLVFWKKVDKRQEAELDPDRTLSIILSKAFLLAEDEKIKDASILSQIRRA